MLGDCGSIIDFRDTYIENYIIFNDNKNLGLFCSDQTILILLVSIHTYTA